ncbi:MAG: 50S ribosomal protein L18 [Candidatus Neomarinimicrobiota bacterium]
MSKLTKIKARTLRRRNRSKRRINDMSEYPRMVVSRSLKNIQAQIIDDLTGKTLVSVTSSDKSIRDYIDKASSKIEQSKIVGNAIAKKAKEKKIKQVWFDRNGYHYTGRVRAMAEAARKTGLKF